MRARTSLRQTPAVKCAENYHKVQKSKNFLKVRQPYRFHLEAICPVKFSVRHVCFTIFESYLH